MDQFLQLLHYSHYSIWLELGQPCGWRWSAPERFATPWSIFVFRWSWFRTDPDWLEQTPDLKVLFYEIRKGVREWNFIAMPTLVAAAIFLLLIVDLPG